METRVWRSLNYLLLWLLFRRLSISIQLGVYLLLFSLLLVTYLVDMALFREGAVSRIEDGIKKVLGECRGAEERFEKSQNADKFDDS